MDKFESQFEDLDVKTSVSINSRGIKEDKPMRKLVIWKDFISLARLEVASTIEPGIRGAESW